MSILKREPAMLRALIVGVVASSLRLLAEFGVALTDSQAAAIEGWVDAVFLLVVLLAAGVAIRSGVTPSAQVVEQVDADGVMVVAGPASELPTGLPIRHVGELDWMTDDVYDRTEDGTRPAPEGTRYRDADGDGHPDVA